MADVALHELIPDQKADLRDCVAHARDHVDADATDEQARNFAIDSWRYGEGLENGLYPTREACEAALADDGPPYPPEEWIPHPDMDSADFLDRPPIV